MTRCCRSLLQSVKCLLAFDRVNLQSRSGVRWRAGSQYKSSECMCRNQHGYFGAQTRQPWGRKRTDRFLTGRGELPTFRCESAPEINPFRRPMMTPVLPQFAAQHQVLAGIWVGSAIRADWGSNGMPIHSSLLDAEKAQARVPIHS
jgi:hypothetical protein